MEAELESVWDGISAREDNKKFSCLQPLMVHGISGGVFHPYTCFTPFLYSLLVKRISRARTHTFSLSLQPPARLANQTPPLYNFPSV